MRLKTGIFRGKGIILFSAACNAGGVHITDARMEVRGMAGYSVSGYHEFRRIQPHEGTPHGGDDALRKGNPPAPLRQGKPGSAVFQRESAARGGEQDILRRGWVSAAENGQSGAEIKKKIRKPCGSLKAEVYTAFNDRDFRMAFLTNLLWLTAFYTA